LAIRGLLTRRYRLRNKFALHAPHYAVAFGLARAPCKTFAQNGWHDDCSAFRDTKAVHHAPSPAMLFRMRRDDTPEHQSHLSSCRAFLFSSELESRSTAVLIMRWCFRPSSTSEPFRNAVDREYRAAETAGRRDPGSCGRLFPECAESLLEYFTEIVEWLRHAFRRWSRALYPRDLWKSRATLEFDLFVIVTAAIGQTTTSEPYSAWNRFSHRSSQIKWLIKRTASLGVNIWRRVPRAKRARRNREMSWYNSFAASWGDQPVSPIPINYDPAIFSRCTCYRSAGIANNTRCRIAFTRQYALYNISLLHPAPILSVVPLFNICNIGANAETQRGRSKSS